MSFFFLISVFLFVVYFPSLVAPPLFLICHLFIIRLILSSYLPFFFYVLFLKIFAFTFISSPLCFSFFETLSLKKTNSLSHFFSSSLLVHSSLYIFLFPVSVSHLYSNHLLLLVSIFSFILPQSHASFSLSSLYLFLSYWFIFSFLISFLINSSRSIRFILHYSLSHLPP